MDENKKEFDQTSGEFVSGFDSVNDIETPHDSDSRPEGYTVTPQSGFYTRQGSEIIQDEPAAASGFSAGPQNAQAGRAQDSNQAGGFEYQKSDFSPSGRYDAYSSYSAHSYQSPPPIKKKKEKRRYSGGAVVLASVLAAMIGAFSAIGVGMVQKDNSSDTGTSQNITKNNVNISVDEQAASAAEAVAKKVTPSVIGIRTTTSVKSFFGGSSEATGEGSGVIYSEDGYIITNYHVIENAVAASGKIEVFLDADLEKPYTATVVGYNISSDLAVIKINAKNLTAIEIGDSETLKVGQYVITVGNPGGLEFMDSVTFGIVSGLNRVVSSDSSIELIQTDAAINPGNSGGALVNTTGQLVGINSSKIVAEDYEGMGFAIPVNSVIKICDNIIKKQNDPEPYTGITISEKYTAEVLEYYGYPSGAVILSVAAGSPAENAGLKKGDIITEFEGAAIKDYNLLNNLLSQSEPGEKKSVKIYRSGRYYSTTLTIGSNNSQ